MASFSGLWNGVYGVPYAPLSTNNTEETNNSTKKQLSKLLNRTRGDRMLNKLIRTLTGAAAGGTATSTYVQIQPDIAVSQPMTNGGLRVIATETDISRVTTAADVTMIQGILDQVFYPSPYPTDRSGNGGGSKRNAI